MNQVWRGDGLAGAGLGCVRVSVPSMRGKSDLSLILGVTHFHSQYPGDDVSTELFVEASKEIVFGSIRSSRCHNVCPSDHLSVCYLQSALKVSQSSTFFLKHLSVSPSQVCFRSLSILHRTNGVSRFDIHNIFSSDVAVPCWPNMSSTGGVWGCEVESGHLGDWPCHHRRGLQQSAHWAAPWGDTLSVDLIQNKTKYFWLLLRECWESCSKTLFWSIHMPELAWKKCKQTSF